MQSISLFQFGTGGGGFIGDDHDVLLRRLIVKEHSFESKDRDTGVTTKVYEPGCMLSVEMQILDPVDPSDEKQVFTTQYYSIGNLPAKRVQELGFPVDPKRIGGLGGYSPSVDNETAAVEGPFVTAEGKTDIYELADYSLFMGALLNLGLNEHLDRLAAQGVSCLDGTVVHMVTELKPKAKKAKADAKDKFLLLPNEVKKWGWEEGAAPTAPAASPKAAAAPKTAAKAAAKPTAAAPAPAPTPAPAPAAAPSGGVTIATFATATDDQRIRVMEVIGEIVAKKGSVAKKALGMQFFAATQKEGPLRATLAQIANDPETLESGAEMGLWSWDAASETLTAIAAQ